MRRIDHLMAGTAALVLALGIVPAHADSPGVKVGVLTCHVQPGWGFVLGSSKDMHCAYHPERGNDDTYVGSISKFGVDIGYTNGSQIVWDVIAPTTNVGPGALQGDYAGATASATVVAGAGANALFGGFDRSIALQPVSVEGSSGLDVAAGIGAMSLHAISPPPPPPPAERQSMNIPPPPAPKSFAVFFNFNKSSLTPEAREVVAQAVQDAEHEGAVRIRVTGHTDTVGSESYNERLSVRRALAVKTEMIHDGLHSASIGIKGRGFHDPLVATGPGVREPQNRRAIIDLGNMSVSAYRPALTRHLRSI